MSRQVEFLSPDVYIAMLFLVAPLITVGTTEQFSIGLQVSIVE